jgi:RimJ/RimL family protein N-acetyltransferase
MIIGKKVVIRPMELEDIGLIHGWWNNGEAMSYSGFKYGFAISRAALEKRLRPKIEKAEFFPRERMYILCRKEDMEPIGEFPTGNGTSTTKPLK